MGCHTADSTGLSLRGPYARNDAPRTLAAFATTCSRTCEVDIALRWGIGYDTTVQSFVNIIATPKGGTHVTGFEQAVLKTLRAADHTLTAKESSQVREQVVAKASKVLGASLRA